MRIQRQITVLDADDISAESRFWARLLGGTVVEDPDFHCVFVEGSWRLGVQHVPDHRPPQWPDGVPQQIHLDLYVDDVGAAHDTALAAGARLLRAADDPDAREGFHVYADPAGHPFCLCWNLDIPDGHDFGAAPGPQDSGQTGLPG